MRIFSSLAPPSKRPRTNGSLKREIEIDSSEDERETNSPVVRTEEANNEETPQATTANGTDAVERSISTTAEQSAALDPLKDFLIACTGNFTVLNSTWPLTLNRFCFIHLQTRLESRQSLR